MAPAGVAKDVAELVAPAGCCPCVAEHFHPFMKCDAHGIVGVNVGREAETDRIRSAFGFEGAEELVPDDERAAMVAVDIARIGAVMNAVVRRSVENRFQRTKRANQLRVNPELVKQADGFHGHDHDGSEANDRQPHPEDETHEASRPRLAKGGGQVVPLRRVVNDVGSPEETALVAYAVEPVIAEFVAEEE